MSELAPTTLQECSRRSSRGQTHVSRDCPRFVSRPRPTSTESIHWTRLFLRNRLADDMGGIPSIAQ